MTKSQQKSVTLPSGSVLPLNGFGTWRAEPGQAGSSVRAALDVGYRHIDCAAIYMNEGEIGEVFHDYFSGDLPKISRSEVFITSKVWNSCHSFDNVVASCKQTLKDLQLEYLDLLLIHFPVSWKFGGLPIGPDNWVTRDKDGNIDFDHGSGVTLEQTWRGMEKCLELGLVRNIGVSNYPVIALLDLYQYAKVRPAVNQCECHVFNTRNELRNICENMGIHFTMYSILGSGKDGPLSCPTVCKIAEKHSASPAQVLIAWGLSQNCSVLAKSVSAGRVEQNFAAAQIALDEGDVQELNKLDRELRVCDTREFWNFPVHV